jgi:hypothetical protein
MMPDSCSTEIDIDNKQTRIEVLGRLVNNQNQEHFRRMICGMSWSGVVDITGWTLEAVKALVKVCSDENLVITLKQDTRYFMPLHYPRGLEQESFAKMIMTGLF